MGEEVGAGAEETAGQIARGSKKTGRRKQGGSGCRAACATEAAEEHATGRRHERENLSGTQDTDLLGSL